LGLGLPVENSTKTGVFAEFKPLDEGGTGDLPKTRLFGARPATEIDFPYYSLTDLERLVQITAAIDTIEEAEPNSTGPPKHPLSGFRRRCSFPNDSVAGCDESPDSSTAVNSVSPCA
jgi:hypothetical protein